MAIKIKNMKIITKHTVEKEHEITLPHYRSIPSRQFYYKIISDTECLMVWSKESSEPLIGINFPSQAFLIDGNFEVAKEEFDKAYNESLEILNSKL